MNPPSHQPSRPEVLRRNNVVVKGHEQGKPALVFVNGFGSEQSTWRAVTPSFAGSHRIVLFDHVGTGGSQRSAYDAGKYSSLHGYADDLLAVCEAATVPGAVLIGHGVGAMIAILAAIRRPRAFRQLVLVGPSPCFLNDGSYLGGFEPDDLVAMLEAIDVQYEPWAHEMAPLITGSPERPELAREVEAGFNHMDGRIARQFASVIYTCDHRAELPLLATPTVIVQCADDNVVPEVVCEFMRDTIPNCLLIRLEGVGHWPQLSAPGQIVATLAGLLEEGWSTTEPAELGSDL
ncbi:MAG: alpha/beta hydrolase [Ramlibacter sp.]|nr:alpha/beta hydrolase [Ramlibacter sp.]